MPEHQVPRAVLRNARGLAIMRVVKVGFVFSGKGGDGVVIARTGNGWSGPSFIGTGGAGWGLQIGAQVTDFVFVLNKRRLASLFARRKRHPRRRRQRRSRTGRTGYRG
jgi:lipid-binding SYLF domain-containing protein